MTRSGFSQVLIHILIHSTAYRIILSPDIRELYEAIGTITALCQMVYCLAGEPADDSSSNRCSGSFSSGLVCAASVDIGFDLCVPLVDRVCLFFCQFWKKQQFYVACILTHSPCQREFYFMKKLKSGMNNE